jgi:DNA-binding MarR family transcriptional regulator
MARESAPTTTPAIGLVDSLAQLSFLVLAMLERRAAEHHLSIIQTRLLGVLRDRRPKMHELAELLGLDKSSTTGLVDRAERRDLVRRVRSTADRRSVLVELTDPGRALVTSAADRFETDVVRVLAPLSVTERQELAALMSRVLVAEATRRGLELFDEDHDPPEG